MIVGVLVRAGTHPPNATGHGRDGSGQTATRLLIVSAEGLIPAVRVEVEPAGSLASFVDDKSPRFGDVVVGALFVVAVCLRLPVGQFMNQLGGSVKEIQGFGRLRFGRRQELWREVGNSIDEGYQGFLDTIIGIFGAAVSVRDGAVELVLVSTQDFKSSINGGPRGLCDDFVADLRVRLANSLEDSAKLGGVESFEESRQVERSTGYIV